MPGPLTKPVLRGHFNRQLARHVFTGSVLACIAGVIYKVTYMDPKKKAYADFYKTYDAEKEYIRMRDLNLFQSVPPGGRK